MGACWRECLHHEKVFEIGIVLTDFGIRLCVFNNLVALFLQKGCRCPDLVPLTFANPLAPLAERVARVASRLGVRIEQGVAFFPSLFQLEPFFSARSGSFDTLE